MALQDIANYATIIATIISFTVLIITLKTIKKVDKIEFIISDNSKKIKQDNRWNYNKNAWNDFNDNSTTNNGTR